MTSSVHRQEVPLPAALVDELCAFWEQTFSTSYAGFRAALGGSEVDDNRDVIWVLREDGRLAGTCHLTTPTHDPSLGGLGEVATARHCQRRGIATRLCTLARDEFLRQGGRALFLGTGNPEAARIYGRLGWQYLTGANVMVTLDGAATPEAFLADLLRPVGDTVAEPMTPAARIPMIPLLVAPHDSVILDANAGLVSTRHAVQHSCMGLFPRYESLTQRGAGAVFCAATGEGRLLGLSTATIDASGACLVDGFVRRSAAAVWPDLVTAALDWGAAAGATGGAARVAAIDADKRHGFEALGFRVAGPDAPFQVESQQVEAIHMTRS